MITNRYNLPQHLVDLVANDEYTYKDHRYSVTELLNSTKEIILKRRYKDDVVTDISDHINLLFGTAFHSMMETGKDNEEIKVEHTLPNGITVSGRIDLVDNNFVVDYKTTTVWKIKAGDFSDWEEQATMYAWLLRKQGVFVDNLRIIAFIKDFSKSRKDYEPNYPESAIYVHEARITSDDIIRVENKIINKTNELNYFIDKPNSELPQPSDSELWKTPDTWAVFKNNSKRALKVYDNEADALAHGGDYIEHREGSYRKLEYSNELRQVFSIAENNKEEIK